MQTKTKAKSRKAQDLLDSSQNTILYQSDFGVDTNRDYVLVGAVCNDGTFTETTGRGAGSHHNGIKYRLYAKNSQLMASKLGLSTKISTSPSFIVDQNKQSFLMKDKTQGLIKNLSGQKKKQKKISLKDTFRTKAKKTALFEKVQNIFINLYKDQLQIVQQELDDQLWLILSAVSNLFDELQSSKDSLYNFENQTQLKPKQKPIKSEKQYEYPAQFEKLKNQIGELKKQNQSIKKEIQKITKSNQKFEESLKTHKNKQKNFKKVLKIIQKQNPKVLNKALDESKINISDLKTQKHQNKVITRSMAKIQKSQVVQQKFESLFSSDGSQGYDQDHTLVGIIRSMM